MNPSFLSIMPPLVFLCAAIITRKVNISLIVGIISGAYIASNFSLSDTISLTLKQFIDKITDIETVYSYGFLILTGSIIVLINLTGGIHALACAIEPRLKTKADAEKHSFFLSLLLFIDDYLSNLTVGNIMRPLTDRMNIPRAKLAYLVHSLSGPLVIMVPVSSWVATITSQLHYAGIGSTLETSSQIIGNPFFVYICTIPFIFYSIILISSVWYIIHSRISYGAMQEHEIIAETTGNVVGGKELPVARLEATNPSGSLFDLLFPLALLVATIIGGILYKGNFYLFGGDASFIAALQRNDDPFFVLFNASLLTFTISSVLALFKKNISPRGIADVLYQGFVLMKDPIIMLLLASILGALLKNELYTGTYLAHTLLHDTSSTFLPLGFFIVSLIAAVMTGSSWGTFALMIPIAIPMLTATAQANTPLAIEDVILLFPVLGAIFSGAVCGDHISPISETTIMAGTSTASYPLDHAYTQFIYTIPIIIATACAYVVCGYTASYGTWYTIGLSVTSGITISILLLYVMHRYYNTK